MGFLYNAHTGGNVQASKTVSPATTPVTVLPDTGYDGLAQVDIEAVTSAIDPNIVAGNIKQGVSILGVSGTMQPAPEGDEIIFYDFATLSQRGDTYVSPEKATHIGSNCFSSNKIIYGLIFKSVTLTLSNSPFQSSYLHFIEAEGVTVLPYRAFLSCSGLEWVKVGTVTSIGNQWTSTLTKLRLFQVGVGTAVNIPLSNWTATDVIAEGADAIAELNANIVSGLANRVADRTGDSSLTITFGSSLYNVLTPDTLNAFSAKNWTVASA